MKKSDFKLMIRKIVREEVAMAIQEVITELKQPTQQVSKQKPKKKMVEKKSYTSNSVLNDVLNETANDEWKTMGGGTYTANKMNDVLKGQYSDLMSGGNMNVIPQTDINDRPVTNVPNHLMDAFTKDYSKTLKAMEKKAMKSRGV
jgi:hypothetical protein